MRVWRGVGVASVLAALAVILATAYLEAEGRLRLPWPMMAPQVGTRLEFLGAHRRGAGGPCGGGGAGAWPRPVAAAPRRLVRRFAAGGLAGGDDPAVCLDARTVCGARRHGPARDDWRRCRPVDPIWRPTNGGS